jgi:integrase/recombinase XerD
MTTTMGFVSSLAPHFEAYLVLMRAVGRRYNRVESILRQLDHFVAEEPPGDVLLSRDLLERWLASTPHLAPSTLRCHASAARQFCRYVARTEPRTWIPDRSLCPARVPRFRPYVFSSSEVRELLAGAQRLSSKRWSLGPQTFFALLLVLYATGLRISEALRLAIRNVDLDGCTLFIAETKFFKSRWVPFSASLAEQLRMYSTVRTNAFLVTSPDDPFFISSSGKCCDYSRIARVFQLLVREAGIDASATRRGRVRLHDLRHTFATHRLLRWYQDGADLQAKLPVLATYLGHGNILATHVYLNVTTELLQEASQRFERTYGSLLVTLHEEIPSDLQ